MAITRHLDATWVCYACVIHDFQFSSVLAAGSMKLWGLCSNFESASLRCALNWQTLQPAYTSSGACRNVRRKFRPLTCLLRAGTYATQLLLHEMPQVPSGFLRHGSPPRLSKLRPLPHGHSIVSSSGFACVGVEHEVQLSAGEPALAKIS